MTNKVSSKEARQKRDARLDRNHGKKVIKGLIMPGLALIVIIIAGMFPKTSEANYIPDEYKYYGVTNYTDYARKIRLEVCNRVYQENKEFVDNTYIHTEQDVVVRCATMMGLIGAYESGFYTSRRYIEDNNAHGMKSNITGWFIEFDSTYEGQLYFAEKYLVGAGNNYFKGHKNRNIEQFVRNWSGDSEEVENRYITFVAERYWNMYNDLIKL